jgi:hypothetical protein
MDDLLILGNSAKQLLAWKQQINQFLTTQLKLQLHPKKQHLQLCRQGVEWQHIFKQKN